MSERHISKKSVPYRMRDSCIIELPKRRTITFGLRSFSYVGAKVWNELATYLKETSDLNDFKTLLDTWNGPDLMDTTFSYFLYSEFYIYKSLQSLHCLILSHVSWSLFLHKHFISLMCICIHLCMCVCVHTNTYTNSYMTCAPMPGVVVFLSLSTDIRLPLLMGAYHCFMSCYSFRALYIFCTACRILAHWLMFFVLHTTRNKAYLILSYLKPLSEPMLGFCQLNPWEQISVKIESEVYHFHSRKCIWNCRLP